MGAGLWAALLLVWRLFDKPGITGRGVAANVGIQWGIFFALAAAGALAYAGSRMRRAAQQPPSRRSCRGARVRRASRPAPPGTTATPVLPPERPRRARPAMHEDQLTIPLHPPDDAG